ncbi:DegV family protein [Alicyclobacillus shizuokensis]|uniref:DegV family protein n=1 Tax=Alicyclobacillus shizuokensis TaxID=392014 RepID=UPI00082D5ED0|nr:DegV family protein [Alicyclobacillus shizuokensis]MCL6625438.1 DegV family protein [Alicyclobacillus shizuokensis]
MGNIAFVTDSTAYLTPEQANEYGIEVVPLSVLFGSETFREGVDLTAEQFYARLAHADKLPTTSQPTPGEFAAVFERLLKDHDSVLCLLLSGGLSGTVQSAEMAVKQVGGDVTVVDSRISSYGIAGPLLDGAALARQGGSKEDVLNLWRRELEEMHAYFVIDTLEYLHKGGRIGGASAVFGALLQIKPILTMNDGRIDLFEKVRTHRRAMERMLARFDEDARDGRPLQVGVVHSRRLEDAERLRQDLLARYPNVQADISELGPVIGTHTGPGVLALVYYPRLSSRRDGQ